MEVFQIIKKMEFYEHEFTFKNNVYTLEIEGSLYKLLWNLDLIMYFFFAADLFLSIDSLYQRTESFWMTFLILIAALIIFTYVIRYIFRFEIRKYICRKKKVKISKKEGI